MLHPFKHTEKDSTKNKPHYNFIFLNDNGYYVGGYYIIGNYLYNVFIIPEF